MFVIYIILSVLVIYSFAISVIVWNEASTNKSHWKATQHELEQVWESINVLEGVDPEEVGGPMCHKVSDEELESIRIEK